MDNPAAGLVALYEALAVTSELCGGQPMSEGAARAFASRLGAYPLGAVLKALQRCQDEVKGRLAPVDVIQRIEDGRPGPEEAWALCPKSESDSAVWTDEISDAYFTAAMPLLEEGDKIAARMAFKEAYTARVAAARAEGREPKWWLSGGHDPFTRESVISAAVTAGRLPMAQALKLLPAGDVRDRMSERLGALVPVQTAKVHELLAPLLQKSVTRTT